MNKIVPKYIPKLWMTLAYLALLAVVFALFMGRTVAFLRLDSLVNVAPEFYSHVSNFSISCMLLSIIGYMWLLMGVTIRSIALLGMAILLSNFVYELFLPFINTKDLVDAYYGAAGVTLGFLFLYPASQFGLLSNPNQ